MSRCGAGPAFHRDKVMFLRAPVSTGSFKRLGNEGQGRSQESRRGTGGKKGACARKSCTTPAGIGALCMALTTLGVRECPWHAGKKKNAPSSKWFAKAAKKMIRHWRGGGTFKLRW